MHGILMSPAQEPMYATIRGGWGREHTLQDIFEPFKNMLNNVLYCLVNHFLISNFEFEQDGMKKVELGGVRGWYTREVV